MKKDMYVVHCPFRERYEPLLVFAENEKEAIAKAREAQSPSEPTLYSIRKLKANPKFPDVFEI